MKQFSFVLSLAALALPAIVYGKMSINGWTGPDGQVREWHLENWLSIVLALSRHVLIDSREKGPTS